MKKQEQQFEQLKDSIVGEISVLLTDLKDGVIEVVDSKINAAVGVLAESTARGFDEVNGRLDKVEYRLDRVENHLETVDGRLKNIETEVTLNHEEVVILRSDMNKQFNQVNADIQLNRLLLN